ncbi:MAG TPA: hypothetical protein VGN07_00080 [Steroidobacteraceae bacterium]|jgi:hypothetical protein
MKIQFALAAGILLTLGTAVSATLVNDVPAQAKAVESTVARTSSPEAAQVLAMLEARASSSASVPLARPL